MHLVIRLLGTEVFSIHTGSSAETLEDDEELEFTEVASHPIGFGVQPDEAGFDDTEWEEEDE